MVKVSFSMVNYNYFKVVQKLLICFFVLFNLGFYLMNNKRLVTCDLTYDGTSMQLKPHLGCETKHSWKLK